MGQGLSKTQQYVEGPRGLRGAEGPQGPQGPMQICSSGEACAGLLSKNYVGITAFNELNNSYADFKNNTDIFRSDYNAFKNSVLLKTDGVLKSDFNTFKTTMNDALNAFTGTIAPLSFRPNSATNPTNVPNGWLYCDGREVSKTTYAALFAVIGDTWGSGSSTGNFTLPDLRGAFLRGSGTGTVNGRSKIGPDIGIKQEDQMQGHIHTLNGIPYASTDSYEFRPIVAKRGDPPGQLFTDSNSMTGPTELTGNGVPRFGNSTYPYNVGVAYCIKY